MAPHISPEVSTSGEYVPTLLTRIEDFCGARWPFLAAALVTVVLLGVSQ